MRVLAAEIQFLMLLRAPESRPWASRSLSDPKARSLASILFRRWSRPLGDRQNQGGVRNTQFEVAFADDLPFPADSFDAVVSRFGVMFVASPVDAVREMLRVLKAGRKLALAVWHLPESNPFFHTL